MLNRRRGRQPAYAAPMVEPPSSGLAVAALICGLLFFIPVLPGLLGVIFGIIGINQTRDNRASGRGLAIAGLICGGLSLLMWGSCFLAPLAGFNRAVRQAQQSAKVVQCTANLQQIGAGLTMYANNNNGKYPAKLGALIESGSVMPNVFVCPHTSDTPAREQLPRHRPPIWRRAGIFLMCIWVKTSTAPRRMTRW